MRISFIIFLSILAQESVRSQEFLLDYNVWDGSYNALRESGISEKCVLDIQRLELNLKNLTLWAMEMWESSAREESGVLHGTNYQFGNYDECLYPHREGEYKEEMARQYCIADIKISNIPERNTSVSMYDPYASVLDILASKGDPVTVKRNEIFWAYCVPLSCSRSDLEVVINNNPFLNKVAEKLNLTYEATFYDGACKYNDSGVPYTVGSIGFISLFCILVVLALYATCHHWYLYYKSKQENQEVNCPDIIKCFSIFYHVKQLNQRSGEGHSLEITYGLRIVAIIFIVTGHRVGITVQGPLQNRSYVEGLYHNMWTALLFYQNETFVDMFFVLSGIFSIYMLLKYTEKHRFNFIQIIVFRYIRLVPLYAFVIFFTATLLPQSGSGPLWTEIMETEGKYCRENWWLNLLMVNNYVNVDKMCMVHSWYIPCDFHYFILALIICAIMKNKSRAIYGMILLGFIFLMSILAPVLITYYMNLPPVLHFYNDFLTSPRTHRVFQNMYIKTHTRLSSYILGLFTGYFLYRFYRPDERKLTMTKSIFGCILCVCVNLGLSLTMGVFLDLDAPYEPLGAAIFAGLFRPAKSLCSCLFVLLCVFGEVPFITSFLSWRPWTVLGKLTYGVYLCHMGMQLWFAASLRQPFYIKPFTMFQLWFADIVIAFIFGLIGYLLVEAPSNMLLKIVFMPPKKKSQESDKIAYVNEAVDIDTSSDCKIVNYYKEQ